MPFSTMRNSAAAQHRCFSSCGITLSMLKTSHLALGYPSQRGQRPVAVDALDVRLASVHVEDTESHTPRPQAIGPAHRTVGVPGALEPICHSMLV
jgi:hypothetical protein